MYTTRGLAQLSMPAMIVVGAVAARPESNRSVTGRYKTPTP